MERFVDQQHQKGDVVIIPFPFSNLSATKKRPALVIAKPEGKDIILAQITSQQPKNNHWIKLEHNNFEKGKLPITSYVKIHRIFSADTTIIRRTIGKLNKQTIQEIEKLLIKLFTQ
jgi:mRNA interferase MazF